MSPLFWIDIAALSASTVLAVSLALMVLGADPGRARNHAFAAFTSTEAAWAGTSLLLRLALWIERGNPLFLSELMSLAFALMGPLLLQFTAHYLDRPTAKTDLVASGGLWVPSFEFPRVPTSVRRYLMTDLTGRENVAHGTDAIRVLVAGDHDLVISRRINA